MNCTRCDYPLWNLKDRRCPECGQDFAPSQFKFIPRSVRFCCPHCSQHYFGTGIDGHLVPRVFDCVSCGRHIHMDEMVLLPAEGMKAEETRAGSNPWLDPRPRMFFGRWLSTVGRAMAQPALFMDHTPATSSTGRAVWFAVVTTLICILATSAMSFAIMAAVSMIGGGAGGMTPMPFFVFFLLVVGVVGSLVWLLIWTLLTHLILAVSGPTARGLGGTAQCMSYSSAPQVLTMVPCVGMYLSPVVLIWHSVCAAIMIKKAQKVSALRAVIAVLLPLLVVLGVVVGSFVMMAIGVTRTVTTTIPPGTAWASVRTTLQGIRALTVSSMLEVSRQNGAYPKHAVELLDQHLSGGEFSLSTGPMDWVNFPVGTGTLGALTDLPPARRSAAIAIIVQAQPADVVAHRLGDYVFTYHGIGADVADRGLWVFIAEVPLPAPGAMVAPGQPEFIAGTLDGQTTAIPRTSFQAALSAQNNLRATYNLPALPDPSTVTESKPAVPPK